MLDNEAQLVRRAKDGDRDAFAEIYDRHHQAIYTYVYYRVHDPQVAGDLTGEVFLRLVEKIESFTHRGRPILAWLYTIARNLVSDHKRKGARFQTCPLEEQVITREENLPDAVQRTLTRECLIRSLQHLTEDQQQVILCRFVEGRTSAETAALLGKSEGAVKALQHRALAALYRAMLDERCYEP
jgi:RNA polymerase sigma-70 factor (ECF subfamily)